MKYFLLVVGSTAAVFRSYRLLGLFCAVCCGAWQKPAYAAKLAVVVQAVGAGSDKSAALCAHALRELFAQDERYELVSADATADAPGRNQALQAFLAAEELVQKAKEAYDVLELDSAIDFLGQALFKYERFVAYLNDFKNVTEVLMLLGATHILTGDLTQGAYYLGKALAIDPLVEPDPRRFNPAMRDLFAKKAKEMAQTAKGSLLLSSNPGYADIYLDGKFVGVTPLKFEKVVPGRHFIKLVKEGYHAFGNVVDVQDPTAVAQVPTLLPLPGLDVQDAMVQRLGKNPEKLKTNGFKQLASFLAAETLWFAQVRLDGESVTIRAYQYDVANAKILATGMHAFAYDTYVKTYQREMAVLLANSFGKAQVSVPMARANVGSSPATAAALCFEGMSCYAFKWTMLGMGFGVGTAAAAIGATYWALADRNHNTWQTLPQNSQQGAQLRQEGRSYALLGDVLVPVGVALLGISSVAVVKWEPVPSLQQVTAPTTPQTTWHVMPLQHGAMLSMAQQF